LLSACLQQAPEQRGVTDSEIRIGQTMPYGGALSAYSALGKAEIAYFNLVNDRGGLNGRKIKLISLDDGYVPPRTIEQTRRLVESNEVALIFSSLGTAQNNAIAKYRLPEASVICRCDCGLQLIQIYAKRPSSPWTFQSGVKRMPVSVVACPRFEPIIRRVSEFRRTIGGNVGDLRRVGKKAVALSRYHLSPHSSDVVGAAWTYEVSEVVVVEAATGLLAEPSFLDVPAEQGARSFGRVLLRGRVVFLDVQNDIQSHLVHQSKRRLGRAQSRLKNAIHVLGGSDVVGNDRKRLPLDSGPNPVENKTNALALHVKRMKKMRRLYRKLRRF
jgi:Periplasmic binding protein